MHRRGFLGWLIGLGLLGALGFKLGSYWARFQVPQIRINNQLSLEQIISMRRSIREYSPEPLQSWELLQLLWAAQGITHPLGLRASPSAGATYPLELYAAVGQAGVVDMDAGLYHYDPWKNQLVFKFGGDLRQQLYEAALRQPWVRQAPVNLLICAVYGRTTARYGERGIRYVHMEAGHASQNIYLQAVALGLGTVAVGAFLDHQVASILRLPPDQSPLYIMPVGRLRT